MRIWKRYWDILHLLPTLLLAPQSKRKTLTHSLTPRRYNPYRVLADSSNRLQPTLSLALLLQFLTPSLSVFLITPSIHSSEVWPPHSPSTLRLIRGLKEKHYSQMELMRLPSWFCQTWHRGRRVGNYSFPSRHCVCVCAREYKGHTHTQNTQHTHTHPRRFYSLLLHFSTVLFCKLMRIFDRLARHKRTLQAALYIWALCLVTAQRDARNPVTSELLILSVTQHKYFTSIISFMMCLNITKSRINMQYLKMQIY
jgi:hypothetical protein